MLRKRALFVKSPVDSDLRILLHSSKMKQKHFQFFGHNHAGSTLLDMVLSLFVLSFMVLLVGTLLSSRDTNRRILQRAQAAALADEELNALRRLDVTTLTNQTNVSFKSVLYNAGSWNVVANGTAGHTSPNALELTGNAITGAVSGRLLFPAGVYADATLEAKWRLASDSPAAAGFGYIFRATDSANEYRLRFARTATDLDGSTSGTQNVVLDKVVSGTATTIDSRAATIAVDTWYDIKVILSGGNISVYLNGTQLGSGPFADATYASGSAALIGWGGAHLYADDVQTITGNTDAWNFDTDTNLPAAWVRLGLNDLPDNTSTTFDDNGLLTIATYPTGSATTSLKIATIVVSWLASGNVQSYTASGLIGRGGLGQ